ncbi:MAG TPA: outer membrane beta-barrel protein [Saprospiraceae bacterium]|nr:outer membrane beta-barrel protein [Saprospiraceae bacterium]
MKRIYYTLCTILLLAATTATAQNTRTSMTYAVGFGTGDLGDFNSQVSWRGFQIDMHKMLDLKMGLGGSFGWNVFYDEKDYDTYTDGTASLSGKQYRYTNALPLLASFNYYMNPGQKANFFVGLGTGVTYIRRNTDMNLYTIEQEAWAFTLAPEIGIEIQNNLNNAFTIAVKYFNGLAAGDFDKTQSYITLNVGWTFKS